MKERKVAIVGAVGVPAGYGGFETLAENLARCHHAFSMPGEITVYCSGRSYPERPPRWLSARLEYVPFGANGVQSILYDVFSLLSAIRKRNDTILLLGVSGAVALPFVRMVSSVRIVTNIDGIEWKRAKWRGLPKWFLRVSERLAVRFSHEVIADNTAVAEHVETTYGAGCHVIAYGGDHAVKADAVPLDGHGLPEGYALSICRIEPENNVHMVLEAFGRSGSHALVVVGNWDGSRYGGALRERYAGYDNLFLLDPVYDPGRLRTLRSRAACFVHGHSAGGTNPSLVEAMHFGKPVFAFDCTFNRNTTEGRAFFFSDADGLASLVETLDPVVAAEAGRALLEVAQRRYTWDIVAQQYFALLGIGAAA